MHEARYHEQTCALTLTYAPKHLPKGAELEPHDIDLFLKRLRNATDGEIKYMYCGEYGPNGTHRPHYHMLLFGRDFPDKEQVGYSEKGFPIWESKELKKLWPLGRHTIQPLEFDTAAYVAKYTQKMNIGGKIRKDTAKGRRPEFNRQSNQLGLAFFNEFWRDMYPSDECCVKRNGRITTMKPPRYYDKKYEELDPEGFKNLKRKRTKKALKNKDDNTPERLAVKEELKLLRTGVFPRDL